MEFPFWAIYLLDCFRGILYLSWEDLSTWNLWQLFRPAQAELSGSRRSLTAPRPPQNRACASQRTRLKHITNNTALCALIVGQSCVRLPVILDR